jgi:hypothetical protein
MLLLFVRLWRAQEFTSSVFKVARLPVYSTHKLLGRATGHGL